MSKFEVVVERPWKNKRVVRGEFDNFGDAVLFMRAYTSHWFVDTCYNVANLPVISVVNDDKYWANVVFDTEYNEDIDEWECIGFEIDQI